MIKNNRLSFAKGNAKLAKNIALFSLPAGWSCPAALLCLSKSNRVTGKLTDGNKNQFRCYAASAENLFKNIRKSRWHNFDSLKGKSIDEMTDLIVQSLPRKNTKYCRIHASGDFFNQSYFDAWLEVAKRVPTITFYAYTKMLHLWIARKDSIPQNFKLIASEGGLFDKLIATHNLRYVKVVFSEDEAKKLKLPIDKDDSHAYDGNGNFSLLLHGIQSANSRASKAWQKIKTKGQGGYKSDYFAHYDKKKLQIA